jgi:hypothetical protein
VLSECYEFKVLSVSTESEADPKWRARTKNLAEKIAALGEKRGRYRAMLAQLERTGEDQISLSDPDSRAMAAHTKIGVGYNIQVAVPIAAVAQTGYGVSKTSPSTSTFDRSWNRAKESKDRAELVLISSGAMTTTRTIIPTVTNSRSAGSRGRRPIAFGGR